MDQKPIIYAGLVQGAGLGLTFLPLNLMAFSTINAKIRTYAASVAALTRSFAGSVMIAISSALLVRNVQVSHSDLVSHVTSTRLPILSGGFIEQFGFRGTDGLALIDLMVNKQAAMIAYIDVFYALMWLTIGGLPLILLARRTRRPQTMAVPLPDAH